MSNILQMELSFLCFALDIFDVNNITFLFPHICTVFTFCKKNKNRHQTRCYIEDNWSCLAFIWHRKQNNHTSTFSFLHSLKDKLSWLKHIATRTSSLHHHLFKTNFFCALQGIECHEPRKWTLYICKDGPDLRKGRIWNIISAYHNDIMANLYTYHPTHAATWKHQNPIRLRYCFSLWWLNIKFVGWVWVEFWTNTLVFMIFPASDRKVTESRWILAELLVVAFGRCEIWKRGSGVELYCSYERFLLPSRFRKLDGRIFISANSMECSWPFQWNQFTPWGRDGQMHLNKNKLSRLNSSAVEGTQNLTFDFLTSHSLIYFSCVKTPPTTSTTDWAADSAGTLK